ncbi:nitronate monooxygenase [Termitidicoccus mucosus]|uniref:2-nitropropane dioxygenase n=1 Tax=Termitidicoccus mucosus TaxID=1184151 RepID=A0A178IJ96_9BACT|nr:2-nitropropane dioxygenase [Opitutaceae bacterium TSB47]
MDLPQIIQGGMGVAISNWRLARSVSAKGQLGVVSGTSIDTVHARILQDGDRGGFLRDAYRKFPIPEMARRVLDRWFSPEGRPEGAPYKPVPFFSATPARSLTELTAVAAFGEVTLAKGGSGAPVGINLLDKIKLPQLATLYGAMLAGVDYVLMGAGIPRHVPGVLDKLSEGLPATMKVDVEGGGEMEIGFDPEAFLGKPAPRLKRPHFLAIISSATLALSLARKCSGKVDGFIVESSIAGGHNAPPRGVMQLDATGQPVYGPRDEAELDKIAALGLPFWLAGGRASAAGLASAKAAGAAGIQVGTAFACCEESGMEAGLRRKLITAVRAGSARVFTDPLASPTGFPFKIVQVEGTVSEKKRYEARTRICDLGYLRSAYRKPDGAVGFRCASEPVADYIAKGGALADTENRMCLCNGLLATSGLAQSRKNNLVEDMLATAGDALADVVRFLKDGVEHYSAADVIDSLLALVEPPLPVSAGVPA